MSYVCIIKMNKYECGAPRLYIIKDNIIVIIHRAGRTTPVQGGAGAPSDGTRRQRSGRPRS